MKADQIVSLLLKLAPLLKRLLQKQTRSPEEQERIRQASKDALLKRKVNAMSEVSNQAPVPSPRGILSREDIIKLVRTAVVVAAGAGVAELIKGVPALDLGVYDDVITPIVIMLLEAVRRFLAGPKKA